MLHGAATTTVCGRNNDGGGAEPRRRRREGMQEGSGGVWACGSDGGTRSRGSGGYLKKAFGWRELSEREVGEDGGTAWRHGVPLHLRGRHLCAPRGKHQQLPGNRFATYFTSQPEDMTDTNNTNDHWKEEPRTGSHGNRFFEMLG